MKRQAIIQEARTWIDTPYHHLAAVKGVGCDCIGLLIGVWKELLGELPSPPPVYSPQWHLHQKESQLIQVLKGQYNFTETTGPKPGSVLCFGLAKGPAHHAGIMTERGTFVHSIKMAKRVAEVTLDNLWSKRLHVVLDYPYLEGE